MIYDRMLILCRLDPTAPAVPGRLEELGDHYYAPMEVYHKRYFEALQAGVNVDTMVRIPDHVSPPGELYAIPEDGLVYRVVQLQTGWDENSLPVTTLSLSRTDRRFEIYKKE